MHGILTQGWPTARLRRCRYRCPLPAHWYVLRSHYLLPTRDDSLSSYQTALMLDRLISINDRIPLSPYVSLPLSLVPGCITDFRSFLVDFIFLGGRGRVYHLDPMINRMPHRESISRFHSASVPQISILEYLRRIVRFTNVEVCPMLSPLSSLPFILYSFSVSLSFFFENKPRN